MPDLLTAFALVAAVLTVSALASGLVERAPLSFPIIFLGLGFLLGQRGIGLLTLGRACLRQAFGHLFAEST